MQDVFRTVPGSFGHLVVPLLKQLYLLSSSLNYMIGWLEMELSDKQLRSDKPVWNGAVLGWLSIWLGDYLEFLETLCTGEGAEGEHQTTDLHELALYCGEKWQRKEWGWGMRSIRIAVQGCPPSRWWGARRRSASYASAKMQLFKSPPCSIPVFALPPCTLKLGKASQSHVYQRCITFTNSLPGTRKSGLLKTQFKTLPPRPSSFGGTKSNLLPVWPL